MKEREGNGREKNKSNAIKFGDVLLYHKGVNSMIFE